MTQIISYNLIDESWIPCVQLDGVTIDLNIREVFLNSHNIASIAGDSPPVTIAIFRFLLAILHRIFGPTDEDEWQDLWESQGWDMHVIDQYLNDWHSRFDLFEAKHPFFQSPDTRMKFKSTISLSHDRASGNNPTFFDHHTEDIGELLMPAQAARILITAQSFGLAGLSGITQKFTDGSCASGILFIVIGENLKQTFLLNMIKYPTDSDHFFHTPDDLPAWEMDDPFLPDRSIPFGYLDYLTWQNRRVLFQPVEIDGKVMIEKMTMGPALRLNPDIYDPMKHYHKHDKLGYLATSFREDRSLWRDSAALFAFKEVMDNQDRPPVSFRWLRYLIREAGVPEQHRIYNTGAFGIAKKQAKVFFFRQEQLPLPFHYLTEENLVATLDTALNTAETIGYDLERSVRLMGMIQQLPKVNERDWQKQWAGLNANTKSIINAWIDHTGMERNYWAALDLPFQSFIIDLVKNEEEALLNWHRQLRWSALNAFRLAADSTGEDARAYKAIVRAESYLHYRLSQVLPSPEKEENT